MSPSFSIIITVYNRPDEVRDFLESLTLQKNKDFEVIVVEDSPQYPCEDVCEAYSDRLSIYYYFVPPAGRSEKRNFGMAHANGGYFVIFDTDCIIPPYYFEIVQKKLGEEYADCYGGPDNADSSFTKIQKAINFSMTSFMTTGGIRGGKESNSYTPRSFNMGLSREVFSTIGGFRNIIGEDTDFSIRIRKAGFTIKLYKEAFVYHKRKIDLHKFYKQVNTFGRARMFLSRLHPESFRIIGTLPALFTVGNIALVMAAIIWKTPLFLLPILLYILAIFTESWIKNKKISIALLSIVTSYIQLFGYGFGFLSELFTKRAAKASQEELYK